MTIHHEETLRHQIEALEADEREIFNVRFSLDDVALYKSRMDNLDTGGCSCHQGAAPCSYCRRDIDISQDVLSEIDTEMKVGRALLSTPCEPPKPIGLWAYLKLAMQCGRP